MSCRCRCCCGSCGCIDNPVLFQAPLTPPKPKLLTVRHGDCHLCVCSAAVPACSSRSLHQLAEHQELEEPPAGQLQQQQQPEGRQPGSSILPFLLSPVLALVAALLLLLRAAARALGSRRRRELTALACGVVIIAAQAALILQQRQQVADLQVQLAHAASPLAAVAGGRGHQVAAAAAVLGREVSQLQRALQSIQVQLNGALRKAKELGQQVQHTTAAPAASQTA